jgi:hypothetical protein
VIDLQVQYKSCVVLIPQKSSKKVPAEAAPEAEPAQKPGPEPEPELEHHNEALKGFGSSSEEEEEDEEMEEVRIRHSRYADFTRISQ